MIGELLPGVVVCRELIGDDAPVEPLLGGEEELVARAVDKRRAEFTGGRTCARRALRELGYPDAPILSGGKRQPLWPAGVVGSITHCAGYRAAAVARRGDLASVGIDAETHAALPDGVLDTVSLPEERTWIAGLAGDGLHWDRILFSAKESVYKAWFPLVESWLGFEEARITVDPGAEPNTGAFTATLLVDPPDIPGPPLTGFTGRYLVRDGFIRTAIATPPRP